MPDAPSDDRAKVMASYRRKPEQPEFSAKDEYRKELREAKRKLSHIADALGCSEDEIIPTLDLLEKQIEDARAIVRRAKTDGQGTPTL